MATSKIIIMSAASYISYELRKLYIIRRPDGMLLERNGKLTILSQNHHVCHKAWLYGEAKLNTPCTDLNNAYLGS